jgi:hypothetical protein
VNGFSVFIQRDDLPCAHLVNGFSVFIQRDDSVCTFGERV